MVKSKKPPIYVKELHIQNFKSFKDFKIRFDDFNIIVGVNNSGKSTILQGITICYYFLIEMIAQKSKLKIGDTKIFSDLLRIGISDYKDAWHNKKLRRSSHDHIPIKFTIKFSNDLEFEFSVRDLYGGLNTKIENCTKETPKQEIIEILQSNPHYIPGFVGVLPNEEYRTVFGMNKAIHAGRQSEVLKNTLLYLKQYDQKNFKLVNNLIEKHFHVKLVKNTINPRYQENVSAVFQDKEVDLDVSLGGSGFLQILQMLTFILATHAKIVLLDEPDAHLHPSLQSAMIQMVKELGNSQQIQFIISTHSKEIVNSVDPEKILHISNENPEAKRLTSEYEMIELLGRLGSIDNIDLAILMKTKKCLFVEGNEDKIIRQLAQILNIDFSKNKQLVTIRRNGTDNNRYYDDLTIFRKFIGSDLKAYSIIDRDVKTKGRVDGIIAKSNEKGVKTKVLKKHEIENYFLINSLLERMFNEKLASSGVKVTNLNKILNDCTEELKQDFTDQLSQELVHWSRNQGSAIDVSTANRQAREIVDRNWSSLEKRLSILPGKELLNKINAKMQAQYGVSTSAMQLASHIHAKEIDDELVSMIKELSTL